MFLGQKKLGTHIVVAFWVVAKGREKGTTKYSNNTYHSFTPNGRILGASYVFVMRCKEVRVKLHAQGFLGPPVRALLILRLYILI